MVLDSTYGRTSLSQMPLKAPCVRGLTSSRRVFGPLGHWCAYLTSVSLHFGLWSQLWRPNRLCQELLHELDLSQPLLRADAVAFKARRATKRRASELGCNECSQGVVGQAETWGSVQLFS